MHLEQFIATSAADAAQQIRTRLGPEAVVVNIRQLPGRWFQKPRIEVLARRTEPAAEKAEPAPDPAIAEPISKTSRSSFLAKRYSNAGTNAVADSGTGVSPVPLEEGPQNGRDARATLKPSGREVLESLGLLPLYAEQVLQHMPITTPPWLAGELNQLRAALERSWIQLNNTSATGLHVFVGAPGVGKTTVLEKWLTVSVLLQSRRAHVWRLDGETANTAESLSVHGEILRIPVERSWSGDPAAAEIAFVDLPGTNHTEPAGLRQLAERLRPFANAQIHLVLNAAYAATVLLDQARAFARLPLADLIITHLDEEPRWGKLWNLVLGTGLPIRYLSAGQNIPGAFWDASAERVLTRVFSTNSEGGKWAAH